MKILLIVISALDAVFGTLEFSVGHYGFGIWFYLLSSLLFTLAITTKEKTDDNA